jgi:hypothetical protein
VKPFNDEENIFYQKLLDDDEFMEKALRFMLDNNVLFKHHFHVKYSVEQYMERHDNKISFGFINYWRRVRGRMQDTRVRQYVRPLIKLGFGV